MFYFRYTVGNLVIRESYTSNRIQVKNTVYILRYLLFYLLFDGFEAIFRTGYLITTLVPSLSLNYHRVANQDIRRFILLSAHLIGTQTHTHINMLLRMCVYIILYTLILYMLYTVYVLWLNVFLFVFAVKYIVLFCVIAIFCFSSQYKNDNLIPCNNSRLKQNK